MILAMEIGASRLIAKSDSQLVTNQVSRQYKAKEPVLIKYLQMVGHMSSRFISFKVENVPRELNLRGDLLSKLATSKVAWFNRIVIQETLALPSIESGEAYSTELILESNWMSLILRYLQSGELPRDREKPRI